MAVIGPTFGDEVQAAGLGGLPFTWGPDGVQGISNLTTAQQTALNAVISAHNPLKQRANVIPFSVFLARWTVPEYAKLLQARAAAITSGNVSMMQQYDIFNALNTIDLNNPLVVTMKAQIVTAAILTQARADIIFNGG